jgi:hypothetical protein
MQIRGVREIFDVIYSLLEAHNVVIIQCPKVPHSDYQSLGGSVCCHDTSHKDGFAIPQDELKYKRRDVDSAVVTEFPKPRLNVVERDLVTQRLILP